jgi:hypothetical protein
MSFLLTPDEIILINNFYNMYSTNIRLMESLNRSNEELRNSINNIIHRHNGDFNHNNYFNNNPNNTNNNRNNRNNSNLNRFGRNQTLHDYGCIESTRYGNNNVYNRNNNHNHNRNMNRNRNNNLLNTTNETILQTFFEPVVIFPTQAQIENATRIATFGDIVNPINTSCPISLERFNDDDQVIIIRYCGHIFSVDELNQWFRNRVKCPVCRYDIRNYVSNTYLNDETQIDSNNILSENNDNNNNETLMNQEIPIIRRFDLSNNLVTSEILNNIGLNSTFWRDLFDVNNDNNYYLDPSSNTFLFTMTRYI